MCGLDVMIPPSTVLDPPSHALGRLRGVSKSHVERTNFAGRRIQVWSFCHIGVLELRFRPRRLEASSLSSTFSLPVTGPLRVKKQLARGLLQF